VTLVVFVVVYELELALSFTELGDSTQQILPAFVVSTYDNFLLRRAPCTLNVRYRFLW
jgi:hypothetical protein